MPIREEVKDFNQSNFSNKTAGIQSKIQYGSKVRPWQEPDYQAMNALQESHQDDLETGNKKPSEIVTAE